MNNRMRLLIILLIFCCLSLTAITVQAANRSIIMMQAATATPTPYRSSTPVYNWTTPTSGLITPTPNFSTQTSQAQLTQTASFFTPTVATTTPTETANFTETPTATVFTPTPLTSEPTRTLQIVGESRLLIGTDRYNKSNYWAIPLGVVSVFLLVAAGLVILTKRH